MQAWEKGHAWRMANDSNYVRRERHKTKTRQAMRRLIVPGATCASRAKGSCKGPLELHHVGGDLSGRKGYRVLCRRHNRRDAGIKSDAGKVPSPSSSSRVALRLW